MIEVVNINDGLHLRVLYEDAYLESLEKFIMDQFVPFILFLTHRRNVGGEYDVLTQCDLVQALRNLQSKWVKGELDRVPIGVYVKGKEWFVEACVGDWSPRRNSLAYSQNDSAIAAPWLSTGCCHNKNCDAESKMDRGIK